MPDHQWRMLQATSKQFDRKNEGKTFNTKPKDCAKVVFQRNNDLAHAEKSVN